MLPGSDGPSREIAKSSAVFAVSNMGVENVIVHESVGLGLCPRITECMLYYTFNLPESHYKRILVAGTGFEPVAFGL